MKNRLKILACHNYYQWPGGEDRSFDEEVAILRQNGHEVINYTVHNNSIKRSSLLPVALRTVWNKKAYAEVQKLISRHKPDLMHCTNTFPLLSPSICYAAQRSNIPVVHAIHNFRMLCAGTYLLRKHKICTDCLNRPFPWPALFHKCFRGSLAGSGTVVLWQYLHTLLQTWKTQVDIFYTLTEFSKLQLLSLGLDEGQIVVKYNGLSSDPGQGSGAGDYAVFAGRLSPEKGISLLLEYFGKDSCPLKLKILGDGPLRDSVRFSANNSINIDYLGPCSQEHVLKIVGDGRCVIMASECYETFGRTIIEGYAKGIPIVAPKLGALAELVEHGKTGLLFEPGDTIDLHHQLTKIANDSNLHQEMRSAARKLFLEKFTQNHNYNRLLEIYELAYRNHHHKRQTS